MFRYCAPPCHSVCLWPTVCACVLYVHCANVCMHVMFVCCTHVVVCLPLCLPDDPCLLNVPGEFDGLRIVRKYIDGDRHEVWYECTESRTHRIDPNGGRPARVCQRISGKWTWIDVKRPLCKREWGICSLNTTWVNWRLEISKLKSHSFRRLGTFFSKTISLSRFSGSYSFHHVENCQVSWALLTMLILFRNQVVFFLVSIILFPQDSSVTYHRQLSITSTINSSFRTTHTLLTSVNSSTCGANQTTCWPLCIDVVCHVARTMLVYLLWDNCLPVEVKWAHKPYPKQQQFIFLYISLDLFSFFFGMT